MMQSVVRVVCEVIDMRLNFLVMMGLLHFSLVWARRGWMEKEHNPKFFTTTMNPIVDRSTDTKREKLLWTPDFRVEQPMQEGFGAYWYETHRPYRVSPHFKLTQNFQGKYVTDKYGCYCTTVYKRFRPLAGCAVITKRHIITSAAATYLVLRKHRKAPNLENILGAWYDHRLNTFNSSVYMWPARIHFHPLFTMPQNVNRTHPFPVMWDMSVWTSYHEFHDDVVVCNRAGAHKWDLQPATLTERGDYHIFGYQFMRAYSRRPMPWFKYMVKVEWWDRELPCPKIEWGWFHCIKTGSFAPLGMDIGAPLHRWTDPWYGYRYTGMIGMNVISMKLRSRQMTSYFNDVNVHRAIEFFYDAYMGRIQYAYLDSRFEDSFRRPPALKRGASAPYNPAKHKGTEYYRSVHCCQQEEFRPGYRD